jgi:hypothetical protein
MSAGLIGPTLTPLHHSALQVGEYHLDPVPATHLQHLADLGRGLFPSAPPDSGTAG